MRARLGQVGTMGIVGTLALGGCFTPAAEKPTFDTLAFENPLVQSTDVVLEPFHWDELRCPDGEPATLYAVYRTGLAEPAPVVVFFHAGALDFVRAGVTATTDTDTAADTAEDASAVTDAAHYAGEDRLTSAWAGRKVFETFGMLPGEAEDPAEVNLGALPAALADAGAFTLYPANCWGDLWHNEDGYTPNDWAQDGFHRQGRFMAWAATRIMSRDAEERATWRARFGLDQLAVPLQGDGDGETPTVSLVGLGEGGRAVAELYRRVVEAPDPNFPQVKRILVDSAMDNVFPIVANSAQYPELSDALDRIFYEDFGGDIGRYSLGRWYSEAGRPVAPLEFVWSSEDPQLPDVTLDSLRTAASTRASLMTITDTGEIAHVLLNDEDLPARDAVGRLLAP
jgi:hypothetical protein